MDVRKLQSTGGSSITITLPKKWIDQNNLKDKDLLKITSPQQHMLVLQPTNLKKQIYRSTLTIDKLTPTMLTRELIAHYVSGTDEISVVSARISPEQRGEIRAISNFLTGFEIIDESAEKVILRNIFDPSKFPIPKNVEKIFRTTILMFTDALTALLENDKTLAKDVIERDFEVDKLYLMIKRQRHSLTQGKISQEDIGINLEEIHYFEDVASNLERIADHAVKIAKIAINTQRTFEKVLDISEFTTAADKIKKLLEDASEMVKKLDSNLAHEMLDFNAKIKHGDLFNRKTGGDEQFIANLIEDSFDRVRGYTTNIAEITIDQAVGRD